MSSRALVDGSGISQPRKHSRRPCERLLICGAVEIPCSSRRLSNNGEQRGRATLTATPRNQRRSVALAFGRSRAIAPARIEKMNVHFVPTHSKTPGARRFLHPDGCPVGLSWHYDRAEILTDTFVHIVGLGLALLAAITLVSFVTYRSSGGFEVASVVIYALSLLAMLGFSAAYNIWPVSPRKWWLRRLDHSAIFLFIAATYTPLIAKMSTNSTTYLLSAIWLIAALGVMLKYCLPGRFDRLSIALCLLLGGSGVVAYDSITASLSRQVLWLLAIGGALYCIGLIFHLWDRLRFQNAIWHGFVLIAAGCHFAAITNCVALAGS